MAAALRRTDPALEDASHSLGNGSWTTFFRVVFPQIRPALLGGTVVVMLALLAEFGAFEILGYQTFTTEIFTEFSLSFNVPTACALSLVLVALGLVVLAADGGIRNVQLRDRQRVTRGPSVSRPHPRRTFN